MADEVFAELQKGLPFSEAVTRYSVADDKGADEPGNLGWIERSERNTDWLLGLAFVQPEGKASPPFRSPGVSEDDVYWEILYLDEKVLGYQPPDSEGVRYEASRAIARHKLQTQMQNLRQELFEQADITYNQAWLNHEG